MSAFACFWLRPSTLHKRGVKESALAKYFHLLPEFFDLFHPDNPNSTQAGRDEMASVEVPIDSEKFISHNRIYIFHL